MILKIINITKNNLKIIKDIFLLTKKGRIETMKEFVKYRKKYGINLEDYLSFRFFEMKEEEVATFYTYHMNDKLIDKYNDKSKKYIFNNKELFDIIFKDYLGREWINNKTCNFEEFEKFIKDKSSIFYKKIDGRRGIGAEKIEVSKYDNMEKLYEYIRKLDEGIIEEHIIAHKEINKMCNTGLSTFRVVTLNQNGKCKILACVFMMTNGRYR